MLFPWYTKYPYQNDEVLNLDWVLRTIDNLVKEVSDFVSLNTIKYADPIQWNITTQYETNTVVIDPITGSAYISTKPVPAGVGLNNTDYWNIIFTLDVISANKNITLRDDANNILATFESEVDDWLLWQGTLYIVTRAIEVGQSYVVGYNIDRYTVERFLKEYISNLKTYIDTTIGDLDDLETSVKTDVVAAINSVLTDISTLIGDLTELETTDKDSIVDAINELVGVISTITTNIGTLSQLDTTAKNSLVAAINEVVGYCGDLDDLNTTAKTSLVAAINEVLLTLVNTTGDLTNLVTSDKTSLVAAINEVAGTGINVIDVKKEGAKGDGVTNDYAVFNNILSSLLGGEIILIPKGHYIIGGNLTINKPVTIIGGGSFFKSLWNGTDEGCILEFNAGFGIKIKSCGVNIEGLALLGQGSGSAIEFTDDTEINISSICGSLRNINIRSFRNGVVGENTTFKMVLENVYCYSCTFGFSYGKTDDSAKFTSLTLINCWTGFCTVGYVFASGIYSTLINCCSDYCNTGYAFEKCSNIKMLNCGCENSSEVAVILYTCNAFVIDGLFTTGCGNNVYVAGLVRIQSGCDDVTICNCVEHSPNAAATYSVVDASAGTNFIYNNKMRNINKGGIVTNDYMLKLTVRP